MMSIANFPELTELERILDAGAAHLEIKEICRIDAKTARLPLYSIALGNPAPELPALGFFGGLHGLERIGTAVVLAYLNNLVTRLRWDSALHRRLESARLVFMPLINPGGMLHGTRCNPNGIDLMRNAPIEAHKRAAFMLGGQRLSRALPWFRGVQNAPMEAENKAVCHVVELKLLLSGTDARDWEDKILRMTSNLAEKAANRAQIVANWTQWRTECPVSHDNALRQLRAASRYLAPTHKPPPPLLVLASANDRLVSPDCSRRLAQRWQTDFAEHPGAGHDLPLDDGPWVVQQVRAWRQIGVISES